MYLADCAFSENTGGGGCFFFFLCPVRDIGHIAYSERVLLSSAMTDGDMELYRATLTQCDAEVASPTADQAGGVPISENRIDQARISIAEMGFRRGVTDVISLREPALSRNYWAASIAIDRLQLSTNVKVVVLRSHGRRVCEIQYAARRTAS